MNSELKLTGKQVSKPMLYNKNGTERLDPVLFASPTSEYRGTPFWAWNTKLDNETMEKQIDQMREMGMGGFHVHCRVGLDTEYLGDTFFDHVRFCNEKAKKENMLCWLYDEDRWPSGSAGGLVTKDRAYRSRFLVLEPAGLKKGGEEEALMSAAKAIRTEDRTHLARYEVELNDKGELSAYRRVDKSAQPNEKTWDASLEISGATPWFNNESYVNTLDKKAIDRFIEVTHEKYREKLGTDFGKSIPSIFTDEPQVCHKERLRDPFERIAVLLPFTDDLEQSYRDTYGDSLLDMLPELFWELPEGRVSKTRYQYHRHICERFSQAFCDNVGSWCSDNGLMLTGHMMSEWTLFSQTLTMGEAMRPLKNFALPGIDMLCDRRELSTLKQAQSVAHAFGREGVMSEIYGVTGWDFDFRGHKLAGDWQAALGVTVRVPHLTWMSMAGEAKRDYPASIGYQSPWYKEYPLIEDHFARLDTALTRGKPHVRVGVIHPIESYWLYWGTQSQTSGIRMELEENFTRLIEWLLFGLIDFDFISESLLDQTPEQPAENRFMMGDMAYDVVVVPNCRTLRAGTLKRLESFRDSGGQILFAGEPAALIDAVPSSRGTELAKRSTCISFSASALLKALEPYRDIDISMRPLDGTDGTKVEHAETGVRAGNLFYQMRTDGKNRWLFVCHVNKAKNPDIAFIEENTIVIQGEWTPVLYNTLNGEMTPMGARYQDGQTVVVWHGSFHDSLLMELSPGRCENKLNSPLPSLPRDAQYLSQPQSYTLSEPNVLLLDLAEYQFDNDGLWQPREEILRIDNLFRKKCGYPLRMEALAQPWVNPAPPPPSHELRLKFTVHSHVGIEGVRFAAEELEKAKLWVNGVLVNTQPEGWFVDEAIKTVSIPPLSKGINELILAIPFGEKTNVEWCYLLGAFGVQVSGAEKHLTALPETVFYGDFTRQGLPFYAGNITYVIPFDCQEGQLFVEAPHYRGALMKVTLDKNELGTLAFAPYRMLCGSVAKGRHILEITVFGNRHNAFGAVHNIDHTETWQGPNIWRTTGNKWSYEYQLKQQGLLSAPLFWVEGQQPR